MSFVEATLDGLNVIRNRCPRFIVNHAIWSNRFLKWDIIANQIDTTWANRTAVKTFLVALDQRSLGCADIDFDVTENVLAKPLSHFWKGRNGRADDVYSLRVKQFAKSRVACRQLEAVRGAMTICHRKSFSQFVSVEKDCSNVAITK
jgi:hypothetical protein